MSSDERTAQGGGAPQPHSSPPPTPSRHNNKKHNNTQQQQQQQQQALPPTLFGNHAATVAASSSGSGGNNSGGGNSGGSGGGGGSGGHASRSGRSKAATTASAVSSAPSASPPAPAPVSAVPAMREAWEISPDEIHIAPEDAQPIGEGFFGCVYKALWRDTVVCVKRLKNVRGGELTNFNKELSLCTQLRHPHLLQFLAASTQKGNLCIVTEWMQGGSLYSWIHEGTRVGGVRYSRSDLDPLLRIASEVARACIYLHASRIVHRDLTSSNILLDENLRAKVGDFGLSKPTAAATDAAAAMSHNGGGGNLLYCAPESFLLQQFTEASDVFAFGIILNELMTGARPYKDISPALAASECANRGARPNLASSTPVGIVRLICACWSHDPATRPTFRHVLQTLEELRSEMAEDTRGAATEGNTNDSGTATAASSSGGSSAADSGSGSTSSSKRKSKKSSSAQAPPPPPPINAELEYYAAGIAAPAAAAASASSTSPSKSKRAGKHHHASPAMPSPSPPAGADPLYNRPHTPDGGTMEEGDGGGSAATAATVAASTSADSLTPLISASPSVSAKDVRLFLLCLKKHLPPHDAFIVHKPQISAIDVLCDPTNKNKKGTAAGSTSSAGTAASSSARNGGGGGSGGSLDSVSSLRSRSEGDSSDSTDGLPRTHNCSAQFVSSMYPQRAPSVGELVVCRAKRADDLGAIYELCEYSAPQMIGLAPMQELTRRKMRSISKLVTIGQLDVLRVLHVDAERGCVDLSKKDVSDLLRSETLTYYRQAEAAHHCVLKSAALLKTCSLCLYSALVWPLAARFEGSVFKLLRLSLTNPTLTLGEYRECACLTKWHAANAAALAGTAGVAHSGSAAASTLLPTPRVLPEIARRCEYNRVHLNLSRLTLDCLPRQLVGCSEPDDTDCDGAAGLDGTEAATNGSTNNSKERRQRNSRANSSNGSSRRAPSATQQQQQQHEKASSGGSGGGGSGGNTAAGSNIRPLSLTLRSLNIEENPLRVLSSRIGLFRRLQEINVNCCGLSDDLPGALAECAGLQRLYAFGNLFSRIPFVIRKLLDLTQLNLSANRIARVEVGDLSGLSQLLELSLARNALETLLPGSLPASVQTLDVSANKFARFPESLFLLPNLVSLEIKQNAISVVPGPPPSAMHLPAATSTTTGNSGSGVPSVWPFLEWIDLGFNPIISVHDSLFVGCSYLQWLNLAHTRIDQIPASLFALIKSQQQPSQTAAIEGSVEEEKKGGETDDLVALTPTRASSVVTGLTYLNVTHTALKPSSTSAADWARLSSGIHHFLFDAAAVPSKAPAASTATTALNGSAAPFAPAATNPTSPPPPASPMPALSVAAPAAASSAPLIAHWTVAQVVSWLHAHDLSEFAPAFLDNLVNGDTLLELDKSDLRDLGVTKLGQQKQMLKLIAAQKEAMIAAQAAKAQSAAPTPSISVSASPALLAHANQLPRNNSGGELNLSALSLGARAVDSQQQQQQQQLQAAQGAPPSVAVRRTNSTISPSGSLLSFATMSSSPTSLTAAAAAAAAAGAAASSSASDCDPRNCELVKSVLLNVCLSNVDLCRPVLLRCVVVLLLGSVFSVDEARDTLARTVQAARDGAAAAGGSICSPFSGLYGGCQRAALSISPLLEPLYALSAPCLLPADGTALIEAATTAMSQVLSAAGKGGRVKVCVRPYIVNLLPTDQAAGATLTPAVVAPPTSAAAPTGAAAASGGGLVAGSASPSTTALTAAPLSSVPSLLLHRTGSAGKHASLAAAAGGVASAAGSSGGGSAAASGLFGEGGEMLAAWTAFRAAKADEAREQEAKRAEQAARKRDKAAAKEAAAAAAAAAAEGQQQPSGEKKKSKRKEGEKRTTKEKNDAAVSAGAFD